MITVTEYKNQSVGVFGLGKAGGAAVQSLLAGGAEVWAWDDKLVDSHPQADDHRLTTKNCIDWPWPKLKALVLSPGIPLTHRPHPAVGLAQKHGCPVLGDIELLHRACPQARYVGITGTNGKSTTTTLLGHILKHSGVSAEIGGNLGTPALALSPLAKGGTYVLELSSYQLDLVHSTRFNVALWLNLSPDHIDRHGSVEAYIKAKEHVFDRQQAGDVAIIGVDDTWSQEVHRALCLASRGVKIIPVSVSQKLEKGITVENGILHDTFFTEHEAPGARRDLNPIATLTGRHNWQNAAAAYAAARALGIDPDAIYKAMTAFQGLRHRLQLVAAIRGIRFINDSKATNADATANALAPYEHIYWIAGGKPKEGGIASLAPYFPKIAHAFLIGEAGEEFARTLKDKASFTLCGTLDAAVTAAAALAWKEGKRDAVVLLSPACASFDQFKNFEERGDAFCNRVEALAADGAKAKHHAV